MDKTPLVTVLLITYNHVETFEKSIQSVLAQKTSFPFQIFILDDASNDGTRELIEKYENLDNVTYIPKTKNMGGRNNILEGLRLVNTKYYTVLETDDWWCDNNKLQTQVDILESNPDCSFCAHNTLVSYADSEKTRNYVNSSTKKFGFPPKKLSSKYYIIPHVSSRLYRASCLDLNGIKNPIMVTLDTATNFYYMTKGKLYYIDKIMSVYNYTQKGVYSGLSSYNQRFWNARSLYEVNAEYDFKYNSLLARNFASRLNLDIFTYTRLKFAKNKQKLDYLYQKILDKYEKKYLSGREIKPIWQASIQLNKKSVLVFEVRREKDRI